jgi:hypothetical protein
MSKINQNLTCLVREKQIKILTCFVAQKIPKTVYTNFVPTPQINIVIGDGDGELGRRRPMEETQNTRHQTHKTKHNTQHAKRKTRNVKHEMQNTKYKT